MSPAAFPYQKVLLKLSGESFTVPGTTGIDYERVAAIAEQVKVCHKAGIRIAVVIGGGNILRGQSVADLGMERATADYMGMLATVINALALQEACEKIGLITRVQSAIEMKNIAEAYIRRKALRHLEKNRIVIFAAGTGNPYFTTDTTASLRAIEVGCEVILKATKVDGVYDKDPKKNADARRFKEISFMDAIQRGLKVMDTTALTLCMENSMPVIVFDIFEPDNLKKLIDGVPTGTMISSTSELSYA
ncbi:MAG: UMP kinase [Leptospiraceae bacterium]|nr:UMP kinase [Leptospiraceae bacterium]